jgi:hypothetical protein
VTASKAAMSGFTPQIRIGLPHAERNPGSSLPRRAKSTRGGRRWAPCPLLGQGMGGS